MPDAQQTWVVVDPDGHIRMVTPEDRAASAEQAISQGWREVANREGLQAVVDWVLRVGEQHGWPLDERWVRDTFKELIQKL